jgi:putative SOS response-associated peptidase YedK
MCFHNGIAVNRSTHIQLNKLEKTVSAYELNLQMPYASGFDYPQWPVLKPLEGGTDFIPCMMHWEFIPSYLRNWDAVLHFRRGGLNPRTGKKDIPHNTLNAIGEEVLNKPTFQHAALHRRCLILSSGFYEWRHFTPVGGKDTAYPYFISCKEREYFFMAGIWNPWLDQETGEVVECFAILTTAANPKMACIHNKKKRMPVILPENQAAEWIREDLSRDRIAALASFAVPEEIMQAYTIRKDFRLLEEPREPFEYPELPAIP